MQRKTTASNSLPDDWEALGRLMALRLAYYVKVYGIPKELVVGLDETPVKTTPNAELATRAPRNSGDVAGVGKENKYQVTATPLISAAGLLGAPSLAELEADPELKKKPALRTQIIFDGVSLVKKGPRKGQPLLTACPTDMLDMYPQFTFAQTPSHFARHESFTLLIEQNLVPYFEAKIEEMGLVGAKKIAELKALGEVPRTVNGTGHMSEDSSSESSPGSDAESSDSEDEDEDEDEVMEVVDSTAGDAGGSDAGGVSPAHLAGAPAIPSDDVAAPAEQAITNAPAPKAWKSRVPPRVYGTRSKKTPGPIQSIRTF